MRSLAMENRVRRPWRHVGLRGRASECALLDDVLSALRRGESRSLVVRGEAGIGKTALLDYLVESASDLTVARAEGVESEMELAYAGLHQLCAPMLDRMVRLPAPQREALEIVFGVRPGAAPDRFLVGLAVLGLLSEVAEERPLLWVVDDAQWLDQASALTLAFVGRRLLAEPVGLVFAARKPGEELRQMPEMRLHGLREGDARALLDSVVQFKLDEQVRDTLIAETRGNPLALLELPRGMSPAQLAGGFGLVGAQALSGRIEESFARQVEMLPDDVRRLLLIAAADPVGDPQVLWRAAERVGLARVAADDAEASQLLVLGERVMFRHPLVRSAIYQSARPENRRAAHLALADVTDRQIHPDRWAWHLAAAATGPDEQVALELERSAGRAQARGGPAASAAFMQRALALTGDTTRRADRALAAAHANLEAGALSAALRLVAAAEYGALDGSQRARVALLRGRIAFASGRGRNAPPLLLQAAQELDDVNLARATYLEALSAALFAGRLADSVGVLEVSAAARRAPPPPQPPRPVDLLLDGLAIRFTDGYAAGAPVLREALRSFRRDALLSSLDVRWGWLACWVAADLWDDETWVVLGDSQLAQARHTGALTAVSMALPTRSRMYADEGDVAAAASLLDEQRAVAEATGIAAVPIGFLWLAALQGREAEFVELVATAVSAAEARGEGSALAVTDWASAVLYNGLGRYGAALAAARRGAERSYEMATQAWALAELIGAAVRCHDSQLAERELERLAAVTQASGTDWALGIEARSRALLRDGDTAESLYREAIERLARTRKRVELARAHLLYGEWLRREGRRVDARQSLRTAYDMLSGMRIDAFAERARNELLATGETARKRTVETRDELTSQEAVIARLARDGLSNPEIGARLFISPRTVKYHLRKVFTKLDITTRHELAAVLSSD
jgi:DNA-binding CsgD family transcriptional regulator